MLNENGATLIELLAAMVIGIIGFLGMMAMQIASISGTNMAKNETAAINLAQGLMEKLTLTPYSDSSLNAGSHPTVTDKSNGFVRANPIFANNTTAPAGASGTRFNRTWIVQDNYSSSGQKMVTVQVNWGEGKLGEKSRSFRFLKSQFY